MIFFESLNHIIFFHLNSFSSFSILSPLPLTLSSSVCLYQSVPDRQYEVKVWAFSKQIDGAAAVWKGRTDKASDRSKIILFMCVCIYKWMKCLAKKGGWWMITNDINTFQDSKASNVYLCVCVLKHRCCLRTPFYCRQAASKPQPTVPPPSGCDGRNHGSATFASSTIQCAAAQ